MTYQEYLALTPEQKAGWIEKPFFVDGKQAGISLTQNSEIHFIAFEQKKSLTRKNMREYLAPMLEQYGMVTTRYPLREGCPKLMKKLGFERMWDDGVMSYWMLTKMPFEKNHATN